MVSVEDMEEIDRWALYRLQEIIRRVRNAYENYQFHVVYYTLYNFCSVDLSALYLDALKDRLYTSKAGAKERRSAQSAMYIILDAMTRLLAPVLVFTAEEIWSNMPDYEGKEESVHMTQFPDAQAQYLDEETSQKWETLIAVKGEISKAIEIARQKKVVGHSLDSCVHIYAPEKLRTLLEGYLDTMKSLLIVSRMDLVAADTISDPYESPEFEGLKIEVSKARGMKCERCWNYSEEIGQNADHPTICARCIENL
jgi:isoleucyl-tRNA synthetase